MKPRDVVLFGKLAFSLIPSVTFKSSLYEFLRIRNLDIKNLSELFLYPLLLLLRSGLQYVIHVRAGDRNQLVHGAAEE